MADKRVQIYSPLNNLVHPETEASVVLIDDIGDYYTSAYVEGALQEIGVALTNVSGDAVDISITDTNNYFTSTHVEGALQEVGANLLTKANSTHNHIIGDVNGLQLALDAKAPLASPSLTGTPVAPTAAVGTNTTQLATTAFVNAEIANDAAAKVHSHVISDTTGLQTALDGKEPTFTKNTAFNKNFGNTAGTVTEGNDPRLSDARTPIAHTHDDRYYTETEIDTALALKAPLVSPALTGTPTAPTATAGTNTTQLATTAFVQTGLGTKANTSHTHVIADVTNLQATLNGLQPVSEKGAANGYASLGADGKVPSTQLPSYVDDVLEYAALASFPATGETGKIYIALDTNKTYRWSGSTYIYITSGAVDSVAGKTGVVNLVKADVGLSNVDNTADSTKSVASAATLTTGRTINGTSFNGSANITTDNWGTSRTITIGSTGKAVNGSGNISWTLAEIGAQAAGSYAAAVHTHGVYHNSTALTGANVYSSIIVADGIVKELTSRALTASDIGAASSTHTHGNITNAGAIGATADLIVKTTTSGVLTTLAAGTSGQFLSYNGTWATPPDTNTTYSAGNGLTLTGTTFDVVSATGTAGSVGTLTITADAVGVTLGTTSTTAAAGNHTHNASTISLVDTGAYYTATNVETVLQEIGPLIGNGITATDELLTDPIPRDADSLGGIAAAKYALLVGPTFTETVTLPSTTSIGSVSSTEIGYLDGVTSAIQTQINTKAPLASPTFTGTVSGITAAMVGLGNVTNESKATMFTSPTFTGTVSGITAAMVGLGNVTNESKATMFTSAALTETPTAPTATTGNNSTQIATTAFVNAEIANDAPLKSASTGTLVNYIWSGTQVQYDAIGTKDANTLYFIVG